MSFIWHEKDIRTTWRNSAVIKIRNQKEETIFTDEFLQFSNHYGFELQTCNPYSGNEKGNVENKVGYVRYNFITPALVIGDLEHLTRLLEQKLTEDRKPTYYKKKSRYKNY